MTQPDSEKPHSAQFMKLPQDKTPIGVTLLVLGALTIVSGFNILFGIAGALISLGIIGIIIGIIIGFICIDARTLYVRFSKERDAAVAELTAEKSNRSGLRILLDHAQAERDALRAQTLMDTECIERIRTQGMKMEAERDNAMAERSHMVGVLHEAEQQLPAAQAERDDWKQKHSDEADRRDNMDKACVEAIKLREAAETERDGLRAKLAEADAELRLRGQFVCRRCCRMVSAEPSRKESGWLTAIKIIGIIIFILVVLAWGLFDAIARTIAVWKYISQ